MSTVELFLNTSAEFFAGWLDNYAQTAHLEVFPVEHGRITLESTQISRYPSGRLFVELSALYVAAHEHDEQCQRLASVIWFEVVPLAKERVEVRGACVQPVVARYFVKLLFEVVRRWPEASDAVAQYLNEFGVYASQPPSLPETDPEAEPPRGSTLDSWFAWYYARRRGGYRITLKDIADRTGYSYAYVRQKKAEYDAQFRANSNEQKT